MFLILVIVFIVLAVSTLLGLVRLILGPDVADRILTFDMVAMCVVGMIIVLSMMWRSTVFVDLILIFSALGFFGTTAFIIYLRRTQGKAGADGWGPGRKDARDEAGQ